MWKELIPTVPIQITSLKLMAADPKIVIHAAPRAAGQVNYYLLLFHQIPVQRHYIVQVALIYFHTLQK